MTLQLPLGISLRESASFAAFQPGGNLQAVADIEACAGGAGELFLYIWGARATGKSHLLQASCRRAADTGRLSAYIPLAECERFTPGILSDLGDRDLVCLDDLHLIAGQKAWEHALFLLFNQLRDAGCRMLVSADRSPARLPVELPDLASRLRWGLSYRLTPLDDGQRTMLLMKRAEGLGLSLSRSTAAYILRHTARDVRSLLALLDRLDRASLAAQRRLTVPFVKRVLDGWTE